MAAYQQGSSHIRDKVTLSLCPLPFKDRLRLPKVFTVNLDKNIYKNDFIVCSYLIHYVTTLLLHGKADEAAEFVFIYSYPIQEDESILLLTGKLDNGEMFMYVGIS